MAARIHKVLKMQVGTYEGANGKPRAEYREIGVEIEHEANGQVWTELKLNLDVLNPQLFTLARSLAPKGSSCATVKKFDVSRRVKDPSAGDSEPPPAPGDSGESEW